MRTLCFSWYCWWLFQKFVAAGDIFDAELDSSDDSGEDDHKKPEHGYEALPENKGNLVQSGMEMTFPTKSDADLSVSFPVLACQLSGRLGG